MGIKEARAVLGPELLARYAAVALASILDPRAASFPTLHGPVSGPLPPVGANVLPWCTTPIEAESSLGPDSHHPIISLSGIPSAVMVLRILHPILASTLCAANPLARIAEPTIAL